MKHRKTYYQDTFTHENQTYIVEGPVDKHTLESYTFDKNLSAFRPFKDQFEALLEISTLPEGRIIIVRIDTHVIGYVTFHRPDEFERWSLGNHPFILELGAIEVSHEYRNLSLGKKMLTLSMKDKAMENYIILTTEYYWHWDLKNTHLDVFEYKELMIKLMSIADFEVYMTNDPEITSHPANTLMARMGRHITTEQKIIFDTIRFKNRYFF